MFTEDAQFRYKQIERLIMNKKVLKNIALALIDYANDKPDDVEQWLKMALNELKE